MFSQNREEEVIKAYYPAWYKGTVLDIGANDGKTLSNTHALILSGWTGVLVEPDPEAFARLEKLYPAGPGIFYLQAAIGTEDGSETFYSDGSHLGKGDTGLLSSLKMENFNRFPGASPKAVNVQVLSWKTFLERVPLRKFDFISCDAEKMDLEILRQIDFKATATSCVCVEWNGIQEAAYDAIMKPFGFKLIHKNGENLIYGL